MAEAMRVHLIPPHGEPIPALHLAEIPRVGDTLAIGEAEPLWRVTRVHWPMTTQGYCERVELHLARVAYEL